MDSSLQAGDRWHTSLWIEPDRYATIEAATRWARIWRHAANVYRARLYAAMRANDRGLRVLNSHRADACRHRIRDALTRWLQPDTSPVRLRIRFFRDSEDDALRAVALEVDRIAARLTTDQCRDHLARKIDDGTLRLDLGWCQSCDEANVDEPATRLCRCGAPICESCTHTTTTTGLWPMQVEVCRDCCAEFDTARDEVAHG